MLMYGCIVQFHIVVMIESTTATNLSYPLMAVNKMLSFSVLKSTVRPCYAIQITHRGPAWRGHYNTINTGK